MSETRSNPEAPTHELIAKRWSPRGYSSRSVDAATLKSLFEAARWGASCFGEQPWRFIAAVKEDAEEFEKLGRCLRPGNAWAKQAPVLMLSVAALDFSREPPSPNRHAQHDVGLAMGNLCLQATSMDLYVHQMGGFDPALAREIFEIPERYDPVAMATIGYLGDPSALAEDLRARENAARVRRPLREIVFRGKWGVPAEFTN